MVVLCHILKKKKFMWHCVLILYAHSREVRLMERAICLAVICALHLSNRYVWYLQFVSTTFWSLWFIDRNLVMPKNIDLYFPHWLNHTMHTFVFVFACLEMVTAYRPYPSRKVGLTTHLSLQLMYLVWWVIRSILLFKMNRLKKFNFKTILMLRLNWWKYINIIWKILKPIIIIIIIFL